MSATISDEKRVRLEDLITKMSDQARYWSELSKNQRKGSHDREYYAELARGCRERVAAARQELAGRKP